MSRRLGYALHVMQEGVTIIVEFWPVTDQSGDPTFWMVFFSQEKTPDFHAQI
jgi:hypothetical protein